jgi:uncharacterized protein (DUF433 family)
MSVALDSLLTSTPGVCGSRLCIAGTRITVLQIATLFRQGWTAEEIRDSYPHLSLAQVYAALAYYHSNREEVERQLAEEDAEADHLEREFLAMRAAS